MAETLTLNKSLVSLNCILNLSDDIMTCGTLKNYVALLQLERDLHGRAHDIRFIWQ